MSAVHGWAWQMPGGRIVQVAHGKRLEAMAYAVRRCMSASVYDQLGTLSRRWQYAYRRGHRIVPVVLQRLYYADNAASARKDDGNG